MYVTTDRALAAGDELRDRVEILDALYRFGLGQDLKDAVLFASAFLSPSPVADPRPCSPISSFRFSIRATSAPARNW